MEKTPRIILMDAGGEFTLVRKWCLENNSFYKLGINHLKLKRINKTSTLLLLQATTKKYF